MYNKRSSFEELLHKDGSNSIYKKKPLESTEKFKISKGMSPALIVSSNIDTNTHYFKI